jgi:hypothetical protein
MVITPVVVIRPIDRRIVSPVEDGWSDDDTASDLR